MTHASASLSRRRFLTTSAALTAGCGVNRLLRPSASAAPFPDHPGERPARDDSVTVLNPNGRVPVSFIIDDSTALVNMGYFCLPQFAEAWGKSKADRYDKPWQTWPREIPDAFVRTFGEFCRDQGVKGKYSIVPYPACVGWVDRVMPGWSRTQLRESLDLVRDFMMPDWDIHPEMISHTRVIDIKTGRPFPQKPDGGYWMENGGWDNGKSVDELGDYIAYALQILKNVDLPCEGFTTPGGFGNGAKENLEIGGMQALRSVFNVEVPHYFKYVVTDAKESTQPLVEFAKGIDGDSPEFIVQIPSCTGDWFGSWDGGNPNPVDEVVDRHISPDHGSGRMVEVIEKGEPACFLTHWPGMYSNGNGQAFRSFRGVVTRLNDAYGDRIRWMKLSEIARYWAAKELTAIERKGDRIALKAPVGVDAFTFRVSSAAGRAPRLVAGTDSRPLAKSKDAKRPLKSGEWRRNDPESGLEICFDLSKGDSSIQLVDG